MSVHKRQTASKGTTWVVRWRDPNGRAKEQTFPRKADADAFERKVIHARDTGTYRDPAMEKVTFGDWYARWWEVMRSSGRARNTTTTYEVIGRRHVLPYFAGKRMSTLRKIDFETWVAGLRTEGFSEATIRGCRGVASLVMVSALENGVIATNPLSSVRLPKAKSAPRQVLEPEEVERLVAAMPAAYQPFALVLAYGGLRPGEAAALQRHLDDLGRLLVEQGQTETGGEVVVADTKTHRSRIVPLPPSVVAELVAHLATRPGDSKTPMFVRPDGRPFLLARFRTAFDRAVRAADLPDWVTPYTLRHTCASLLAQRGVPVATAAALMGHDPAMYLRTYTHLYPGDLQGAAHALESARRGDDAGIARGRRLRAVGHETE
jgi:integrase